MFAEHARVGSGPHHVDDQGHGCHDNETHDVLHVTVHDAQLPARVPCCVQHTHRREPRATLLSKLGFRSRTQIATWVTQRHRAS